MSVWLSLLAFAVCTVVGYIAYEMLLFALPPIVLVVNTFAFLVFANCWSSDPGRRMPTFVSPVPAWKPFTGGYAVAIIPLHFAYWYFFWHAMYLLEKAKTSSGTNPDLEQGATIALAVLGLTTVINPLVVGEKAVQGQAEQSDSKRLPRRYLVPMALALALGIALSKLNIPWHGGDVSQIGDDALKRLLDAWQAYWHPIVLLLAAVFAESLADRLQSRQANAVGGEIERLVGEYPGSDVSYDDIEKDRNKNDRDLFSPTDNKVRDVDATVENLKNAADKDLNRWSAFGCLVLALLLAAVHGETATIASASRDQLGLWALGLLIVGGLGSSARTWLISPLFVRGYAPEVVVPVYAARLILVQVIAPIALILLGLTTLWGLVLDPKCEPELHSKPCSLQRTMSVQTAAATASSPAPSPVAVAAVNPPAAPDLTWSYLAGIGFCLVVSATLWTILWRKGLLWKDPTAISILSNAVATHPPASRACAEASKQQVVKFLGSFPQARLGHMRLDATGAFHLTWCTLGGDTVELTFPGGETLAWEIKTRAPGGAVPDVCSGVAQLSQIIPIIRAKGVQSALFRMA